MIFAPIYHAVLDFINYIYSDGFFSVKSLSFTMFVFLLVYESCKDWMAVSGLENDYFNKEDVGNSKFKDEVKNHPQNQLEDTTPLEHLNEEKTEQLQLYKMFNSKK